MLSAKLEHTGKGIGRRLISAAEAHAKEKGCEKVRLEVLMPIEWEHPTKAYLMKWYERQGYVFHEKEDFGAHYPEIQALMVCKCVLNVFVKDL